MTSGLRPRTSPQRTERNVPDDINLGDKGELVSIGSSEDLRVQYRKNKSRGILKTGLLTVLIVAGFTFAFFTGAWREKQRQSNRISKIQTQETKKTEMVVSWKGSSNIINKEGDLDGDVCVLLSKCFSSKYFVPDPINYPENPLQPCHKTMKVILRAFDNGFYYEGSKLVGFISGESIHDVGYSAINLYNVCVRAEERGKGFAKAMVPEFIKQIVDKRVPKPNPKVYIGLDVDFDTETAVSAFALYAKMGFNRWWEPCPSINDFDYHVLERQNELANPPESSEKRPSLIFPMSQMMLRRRQTLTSQLHDEKGKVYNHFCMVMLLGVDDFGSIGREMKEIIQSALLESNK